MGLVVAAGLAPEPLLMAGCSWCQGAQPTVCPALQGARLSLLPPGLPPCWQSVPVKGAAGFLSYDGDLSLPLGLALGSGKINEFPLNTYTAFVTSEHET